MEWLNDRTNQATVAAQAAVAGVIVAALCVDGVSPNSLERCVIGWLLITDLVVCGSIKAVHAIRQNRPLDDAKTYTEIRAEGAIPSLRTFKRVDQYDSFSEPAKIPDPR